MIHIADSIDLDRLEKHPVFTCVLIHDREDNLLLDQLIPICDALAAAMLHTDPTPMISKWLAKHHLDHVYPMAIIFYPGKKLIPLYQPKLQEVVDYCTGRKFNENHK